MRARKDKYCRPVALSSLTVPREDTMNQDASLDFEGATCKLPFIGAAGDGSSGSSGGGGDDDDYMSDRRGGGEEEGGRKEGGGGGGGSAAL